MQQSKSINRQKNHNESSSNHKTHIKSQQYYYIQIKKKPWTIKRSAVYDDIFTNNNQTIGIKLEQHELLDHVEIQAPENTSR